LTKSHIPHQTPAPTSLPTDRPESRLRQKKYWAPSQHVAADKSVVTSGEWASMVEQKANNTVETTAPHKPFGPRVHENKRTPNGKSHKAFINYI